MERRECALHKYTVHKKHKIKEVTWDRESHKESEGYKKGGETGEVEREERREGGEYKGKGVKERETMSEIE